jgi:hypothetical protein
MRSGRGQRAQSSTLARFRRALPCVPAGPCKPGDQRSAPSVSVPIPRRLDGYANPFICQEGGSQGESSA